MALEGGNIVSVQKKKRYACIHQKECVACGSCINVCPFSAITAPKGIYAEVNIDLCVGCGKCEKICPASVIDIVVKKEEIYDESKTKIVV